MFDLTPDGILRLVKQGESEQVEFKSRLPPDEIVARILIAFANTNGGILLVGVQEDGSIIGLQEEEANKAFGRLDKLVSSLFPWPPQVGLINVNGRVVAYTVVERAPAEYAPISTARGEVFKRVHDKIVQVGLKPAKTKVTAKKPAAATKPVRVFVAMSFRQEEEPALVDYYRAMERAVAVTGLPVELIRMDLAEGDYEISQEIMAKIDASDLVIADFTLNSSNVYFELGYARGRDRRIIQSARKGTSLEFDIRNWRTLFYKNATELEERLVAALRAAYAEIVKNPS